MRILIWDKGMPLKNSGGPSGYLWNIKQYLDLQKDEEIVFYSDHIKAGGGKNLWTSFLLGVCALLKKEHLAHLILNYFYKGALTKKEKALLNGVDYVHFHTLSAACGYNELVHKANVKTILTVHSPEPLIDEINSRGKVVMSPKKRDIYITRETTIMDSVDYLMFPVKGALECYTLSSTVYSEFFKEKLEQNRIFFVPTALPDCDKLDIENYLSDYNIPNNATKICYVGRHNRIKGYEYLKQIASKVWEKAPDTYFIIGGKQEECAPVNDPRWIELGWVKTKSLLQEVDVFILPNQQTYFDIIALEILRSGTPLITTLTGGNHYLSEINNGGITFIPHDDAEKAVTAIIDVIQKDINGKNARALYEAYFTMNQYIKRYKEEVCHLH